jgi:predicted small secreted protein
MKNALLILAFVLPAALVSSCSSCSWGGGDDTAAEVVLCDGCGVEKGAEGCCDADAERCDDCGKIKGSAGCCVE